MPIPLLFGTMTMGAEHKNGVRTADLAECQKILDIYLSEHKEIDTARMYAEGTTEEYLSQLDIKGATVDTKVFPVTPGDHSPEALRRTFGVSLKKLSPLKVRVLYLHAPDRSVPFEDTLREMDKMHKEGLLYSDFGLSNFAAWEVAEIVTICRMNNWIRPRIYQGPVIFICPFLLMYNAITRDCETELFHCLRKFGLRFVAYNPLAGGFFAGKITAPESVPTEEGRFSGDSNMAQMYRNRYFRDSYFEALKLIKPLAEKHGLGLTEIALRWCQHHSALTPADGIILGASSATQLQSNLADSAKGPLPEDIVVGLDKAWLIVKPTSPTYWR
ncbi:Aldo/keto reductase [Gautieria morchelliformis]|nr:Aldo/keto reductase [Gautieria morchelliformis]